MATPPTNACFHCLEPLPAGGAVSGKIKGKEQQFCCRGCLGVAQWVDEAGLDQYYQVRTGAPKADNIHLSQYQQFDLPEIYAKYTYGQNNDCTQIDLTIEGIHCAACMWLIEKSVLQQDGVHVAEGNATTYTLHIEWDNSKSQLSDLLSAIAKLGYQPLFNRDEGQQERYDTIRRTSLKRLTLAGLGMMQVMMYSAALYAGAWQDMSQTMKVFFQWVSFFLATPVFFYSGFPFLQNAIAAIKTKHLNMDVPIALAITLAYGFSVYHLLKGSGEIFFDSVVMFVFFLSASRYIEMMGRYKALLRSAKNTAVLPEVVNVVAEQSLAATVAPTPIDSLKKDDLFLVSAGETIAADGTVLLGQSTVNESLLTGEASAIEKSPQSQVLAGSINQEQTLLVRTDAVGQQTTLSETKRLLSNAQTQKPQLQRTTDKLAGYIVAFILLSTTLTFLVWHFIFNSDNAFEIALSVLVATCPCALSLAVPTAYAAASNALANQRLLLKNNAVIDAIPKLSQLIFDKTGTLTTQAMRVLQTEVLSTVDEQEALAIAAALEQHIHHPIAQAFMPYTHPEYQVTAQHIISGKGVQGNINGQHYTLGNAELAANITGQTINESGIYLCCEKTLVAKFHLSDEINPTAQSTIEALEQQSLNIRIASGDSPARVAEIAKKLNIADFHSQQLPADKLALVKSFQQRGQPVMMVGDGINDAPVLAAANVSLAVGGASALSQSQADVILLNNDLRKIPQLITCAQKTQRIIHQNLSWAILYNLIAVPVAIMGYLPPWIAALGMSISSLVVIINTLRIK